MVEHKAIDLWHLQCRRARYRMRLIHGASHVFMERCAKVRFKIIYNYLMSVEGKLILRRQAVGIKYCGGSFTHRVLGAPIPQRVARRLEHAGTQANPSRLGRIGSQRGINTRLALIGCQLAFSRNWRRVVWNHRGVSCISLSNIVLLNWALKCVQKLLS